MENKAQSLGGNKPPPKPWERAQSSFSGRSPFRPPSVGNTSDVVEASGMAQPGEVVLSAGRNTDHSRNTGGRPVPQRPWEPGIYSNNNIYGGNGSSLNYNSGYGNGMYGLYGGYGVGPYGGGLYGNSMYRGGYTGLYGSSMYGDGYGPIGGYGMGMGGPGGPYGNQDTNNSFGAPPSPLGFWVSLMRVLQGVVNFFGRFATLIDQNTQALHMFMSALLQLFDRSGLLYGELARFALGLLRIRTKPRNVHPPGMVPTPTNAQGSQNFVEAPNAAPSASWDSLWGDAE